MIPGPTSSCHLFKHPESRYAVLQSLETLETYLHDYREVLELRHCKDCGQLYFCEWIETVRFNGDGDTQDYHLIPVTTAEEALALSQQSRWSRSGLPTLVMIWPPDDAKPYWVNR